MELKTIKEKRIIYLMIAGLIVLALLVLGFFIFLIKRAEEKKPPVEKEKTFEETIQSLTAPEGQAPNVPEEVIESLTAPEKLPDVSEEILQSLTAPENK